MTEDLKQLSLVWAEVEKIDRDGKCCGGKPHVPARMKKMRECIPSSQRVLLDIQGFFMVTFLGTSTYGDDILE